MSFDPKTERREKFWKGLVNCWDTSLTFANSVA